MKASLQKALGRIRKKEESAQGLAEYALILALIAVFCIAALSAFGQAIANSPGFSLF